MFSLLSFQVPLISTAISCRDMRIGCLALAWLLAGMHCAQVLYVRHPSDCTYFNTYFMFMNDMIIDWWDILWWIALIHPHAYIHTYHAHSSHHHSSSLIHPSIHTYKHTYCTSNRVVGYGAEGMGVNMNQWMNQWVNGGRWVLLLQLMMMM